jgi:uncharacterized OsmC-like protein
MRVRQHGRTMTCMSPDNQEADGAATLKAILESGATFLEQHPELSCRKSKVTGELRGITEVRLRAGEHHIVVDEPRAAGGRGTAPNPVQFALAALAACTAITYRYWSEMLDIAFDSLRVEVRGSTDLRGILGLGNGCLPGLQDVSVAVHLAGRESAEKYKALHRIVEAHCPLLDTLRRPLVVSTTLEIERVC